MLRILDPDPQKYADPIGAKYQYVGASSFREGYVRPLRNKTEPE